MKRFIVRPRAPAAAPAAEAAARAIVAARAETGAALIRSDASTGQHVVQLADADAEALRKSRPDLIVEEDKPLELFRMPGLPPMAPTGAETVWEVSVHDAEGAPIAGCSIYAVGRGVGFRAETDESGHARLVVEPGLVERVIASPRAGFWSRVVPVPEDGAMLDVTLAPLDPARAIAWVHRLLSVGGQLPLAGRGVKVAVVDSGIAAVPALAVSGGTNTLDDGDPADFTTDEKGHGTHVGGIIAGRPTAGNAFRGIAPEASLLSVKVFPGGYISDLVQAIDWCRDQQVDIVNLSLGGRDRSETLANAIAMAAAAGVTMVAATGNDATSVAFPAALPEVISVGAIGRQGVFPPDSAHTLKVGRYRDWWGGLFSASFTNFGPEVDVCAPGVAIASTVPQGFAAWDGTSMACPVVSGLLALVLEHSPHLRTGTRATVDAMQWLVRAGSADMGMPAHMQGAGLPAARRLLSAATRLSAWQ